MNTVRLSIVVIVLIVSQPLSLLADECADIKANAGKVFDTARAASGEKKFEEAIKLYEEAEGYFMQVSTMECSNPDMAASAKEGLQICRENIENNKKNLEAKEYERAKKIFNQGNSYALKKQWSDAATSFTEAAGIWETIASDKTETGKKAIESVKKANELAETARKRSGASLESDTDNSSY